MIIKVMAVGDVYGEPGLGFLCRKLKPLQKEKGISFTVVNGENASNVGLTPKQADMILSAGADVITLGNHTFSKQNIISYLDENRYILRPANLSPITPGRGYGIFDSSFGDVCVINLIGRCGMDFGPDNPFTEVERIIKKCEARFILVDIHAEATSEKAAVAWMLDGRASAVWGTHTHVQTSDASVLPEGTGFITDLGMTGPVFSILGVKPQMSIDRFLGDPHHRPYEAASGPCKMEGAVFSLDSVTGKCLEVESFRISEN